MRRIVINERSSFTDIRRMRGKNYISKYFFPAFLYLLAMVIAAGCTDKDRTPSGIIPRENMEKILWDMVQADQYATAYLLKDSARIDVKMETLKLYEQVFRLHNVSRDQFRKSFQYYLGRPDLTRPLFDSLLTRGNQLRQERYKNPPVVTAGGVRSK